MLVKTELTRLPCVLRPTELKSSLSQVPVPSNDINLLVIVFIKIRENICKRFKTRKLKATSEHLDV